jgi:hypothetical protein
MNTDKVPQLNPVPPPLCSSFDCPNKEQAIQLMKTRYSGNTSHDKESLCQ